MALGTLANNLFQERGYPFLLMREAVDIFQCWSKQATASCSVAYFIQAQVMMKRTLFRSPTILYKFPVFSVTCTSMHHEILRIFFSEERLLMENYLKKKHEHKGSK